jgi:NADP-dependent 3-hydroxy acid dehydrogenase YdfG
MVNVLIFGATGYIGYAVATSLRRAGHIVHAVVRDASSPKARDLERNEITTHKGDAKDASGWKSLAAKMDVIIDAADTWLGKDIFQGAIEAAKSRPEAAPKMTFIYTSGIWYVTILAIPQRVVHPPPGAMEIHDNRSPTDPFFLAPSRPSLQIAGVLHWSTILLPPPPGRSWKAL